MSIRSISSAGPGLGFARPRPGTAGGRRAVAEERSALSYLTAGDREVIAAMFGPDLLSTGRDAGGAYVGVPALVWLVSEDRRTGRLPVGSEICGSYLRAIRDGHSPDEGPAVLTEHALTAALAFLARRPQGATIDVRA